MNPKSNAAASPHLAREAKMPSEQHRGVKASKPTRRILIFVIAMVTWASSATSYAQSILGSSGAGFQTWTAADLNNNGAPYWDAVTENYLGDPTNKNVGFCLTGTGDCVGILTSVFVPGPIPFWGMTYNSAGDAQGAIDPLVYFKRAGEHLKATLQLQLSSKSTEINEFGWFETNKTGSALGPKHRLFQGSGVPPGSLTPDPVGKAVIFKPTQYFGYYYSDVSENGCLVYTLSTFTDPSCSDHNFAVFATKPGSHRNTYVIAGEDPPGCNDGDCNLTLVRVAPLWK
jgi:hypothetical protein